MFDLQQLTFIQIGFLLVQRATTFLSKPDWQLPFLGRKKSARERLKDLAVGIPELLCRADGLTVSLWLDQGVTVFGRLDEVQDLLDEISGPDHKIASMSADLAPVLLQSSPLITPWSTQITQGLTLPNPPTAGLYMHQWAYHLELKMCGIALCSAVLGIAIRTPEHIREPMLKLSSAAQEGAQRLATMALEASILPSSSLEGMMALQFPMSVVQRYFDERLAPPSSPTNIELRYTATVSPTWQSPTPDLLIATGAPSPSTPPPHHKPSFCAASLHRRGGSVTGSYTALKPPLTVP